MQSDPGDTSRLYTPTNTDTYFSTVTDTLLGGATVNTFTGYAKCRSLDPVPYTTQICVKVSGTNYCSVNKDTNLSTNYVLFSNAWATNPATETAWTAGELDALELGIKKSNAVGMGCTYVYGEVDDTASGAGGGTGRAARRLLVLLIDCRLGGADL